jgi:hypothetical protein
MRVLVLLQLGPWNETLDRLRDLLVGAERGTLSLLVALLVALVGWGIAALAGRLARALLRAVRFNEGTRRLLAPDGRPWAHEPAALASWAVYWIILVAAVILALDSMGFGLGASVGERLRDVLPRVVSSALLLLSGVLGAMLIGAVARRLFEGAGIRGARLRGQIVTGVFTFFAVLLALEQLGFAAQFVMAIGVTAFAAVVLALGLAFGLGCRELARDFVVEYLRSLDEERPQRPS